MPKPDKKLQAETGIKKAYPVTPIEDNYPTIRSNIVRSDAIEKTIDPISKSNFRNVYDEKLDPDKNLREQFINTQAIN